jgi:uncharacterized protein (TIGR03086 family)
MHRTPLGEMPGPALAGFTALDVFVHGWDLASAIGEPVDFDDRLAEQLLEFSRSAISTEAGTRAPRIGPEVPVPDDATAMARLLGYLGRRP